jgi:predicted PurR-regulated permease PerM
MNDMHNNSQILINMLIKEIEKTNKEIDSLYQEIEKIDVKIENKFTKLETQFNNAIYKVVSLLLGIIGFLVTEFVIKRLNI